jgi:hypothetical protein
VGGARDEVVAARALHRGAVVAWMDTGFHDVPSLPFMGHGCCVDAKGPNITGAVTWRQGGAVSLIDFTRMAH